MPFPYLEPQSHKERERDEKEERNLIHNSVFLFAVLAHFSYFYTEVN